MTVAELIVALQDMPQDHKVKAYEVELLDYDEIVEVKKYYGDSVHLVTGIGLREEQQL